ncbi:MAG: sodium-dependent transporter [Pseudomonadota bacterium]|nr:sodium-dependent transporter [Pseudomonadota bacterium]
MIREHWKSSIIFVLAAAGSAVGLGNIWKFPYMVGENGGSAFVLVYLACIVAVGLPILVAEILLGRRGDASPILAMQKVALESRASKAWAGIGWLGSIAGFLIASFYAVVAGWAGKYTVTLFSNEFEGADVPQVESYFATLLGDNTSMLIWGFGFLLVSLAFIALGVHRGLANLARILMPLLILMLLGLLVYAVIQGNISASLHFMFDFKPEDLNSDVILSALGHSFFTLSLGMCAIMVYGSYMPKNTSIGKAALAVGFLDTAIAIIAGVVIYSIVFDNGMQASAGPGLLFQTLPVAFEQLPNGHLVGGIFFLLVSFAALTSLVSIIEPFVAYMVDKGMSRILATGVFCVICSVFAVACTLSLNIWSAEPYLIAGLSIFDALDYLTVNIMLPLGGVLIAIFVGWVMKDTKIRRELKPQYEALYLVWRVFIRWIAPLSVIAVLLNQLSVI